MSAEEELQAARNWLQRLLSGVENANSSAEAVALAAFRQHGPRRRRAPVTIILEAAE